MENEAKQVICKRYNYHNDTVILNRAFKVEDQQSNVSKIIKKITNNLEFYIQPNTNQINESIKLRHFQNHEVQK